MSAPVVSISNMLLNDIYTPKILQMHLLHEGVTKRIALFAKWCAREVTAQYSDSSGRTYIIVVLLKCLCEKKFQNKLPDTFTKIMDIMIKWMHCGEDGEDFDLVQRWSSFSKPDRNIYKTPSIFIEGTMQNKEKHKISSDRNMIFSYTRYLERIFSTILVKKVLN